MERPCTLLVQNNSTEPVNLSELRGKLQNGTLEEKRTALKKTILLLMQGESLPNFMITIIQHVMTERKDHALKKLLLLYWEVCDKTTPEGKLLNEMYLVCNALLQDLKHPNEYVRGITLRFMSRLRETELLEPLIPSIRHNLEDRHAYVRRNAALAIYSIFKANEHLVPDAPELIFKFLSSEGDASCQRNAFLLLFNCAQDKAVEYLTSAMEEVKNFADILQLVIIELVRKVCRSNPTENRAKYLKCIFSLLESNSAAVRFEAAVALYHLSTAPSAVRALTNTFLKLLCDDSEQSVKLIVLDRLEEIKRNHPKVMQELIIDILKALSSPNMEIRRKTLGIALELVTPQNIGEVIQYLKKEISLTQSQAFDQAVEYRQLLLQSIHSCAVRFPSTAGNVVHLMMDFLGDSNWKAACEVIRFVREVIESYEDLRSETLNRLLCSLKLIRYPKVYRAALWIIGEYALSTEEIDVAFSTVNEELGPVPFIKPPKQAGGEEDDEEDEKENDKNKEKDNYPAKTTGVVILSDGTYATQSALSEQLSGEIGGGLRRLLMIGDWFLASVLATALTKLVLRSRHRDIDVGSRNIFCADVMLILVNLLKLGRSQVPKNQADADSWNRITLCLQILGSQEQASFYEEVLLERTRTSFATMLVEQKKDRSAREKKKDTTVAVQADDVLKVSQLLKSAKALTIDGVDDGLDILLATGYSDKPLDMSQRLSRLTQLTGLSDPVYAEAYVNVHEYDIVLDVTIINQTSDTLQNLTLELATMGELKLVDRPQVYTLAPFGQIEMKANIKVASTENGAIFGTIVYDIAGVTTGDMNFVELREIHIDILDYIHPAHCENSEFRAMWAEFEWENKVAVNTTVPDVNEYLQHIMRITNMGCLTPPKAMEGDCGFLSANLYAKSVFSEDALANVNLEKQGGKIQGHIRIRSKTQGIALSLGDKITSLRTSVTSTEKAVPLSTVIEGADLETSTHSRKD